MSNKPETRPEDGVMTLFGGAIMDVHRLITQQLALFRHEFQSDFNRLRAAGFLLATGLVIFTVGGVTLCEMLVQLAARIAPDLPLWACYGSVGLPVSALGATLCIVGMQRLSGVNTVAVASDRQPLENTDG